MSSLLYHSYVRRSLCTLSGADLKVEYNVSSDMKERLYVKLDAACLCHYSISILVWIFPAVN